MVKKKELKAFLHKRWDAIVCNMEAICKEWDKETLHEIRVNTKKIKAVVKLLKAGSKHRKSFSVKPLQQLFHQAGEIRTAQLNGAVFTDYHLQDNNLEKEQGVIVKRTSKEFCEKRKAYRKSIKKLERKFTRNLSRIKNKSIISYYQDGIGLLCLNFIPPINPDVLHDNRKVIKNLLYTLKVLPSTLVRKLNLNEDYLDNLQDLIGQWHDAVTTEDLLTQSHLTDDPGYSALITRKQKLFKSITHLTESFATKLFKTV